MGNTLSVTVGYGIILPWGEGSKFDFQSNDFYEPFYETDKGDRSDWETPDQWGVLEAVCEQFPGLVFEVPYYHDYSGDALLLIKDTVTTGYDSAPVTFEPLAPFPAASRYAPALREAAALLGVPCEPTWVAVASYG